MPPGSRVQGPESPPFTRGDTDGSRCCRERGSSGRSKTSSKERHLPDHCCPRGHQALKITLPMAAWCSILFCLERSTHPRFILVLFIYFSGILWQALSSRHRNFKGSTKHCESCEAGSRGTGWRETRTSLRFLRKFSRLKGEFCSTFHSDERHNTAVGVTAIPGCHVSFKIAALAACTSRRSTVSCFLGSREQLFFGKQRAGTAARLGSICRRCRGTSRALLLLSLSCSWVFSLPLPRDAPRRTLGSSGPILHPGLYSGNRGKRPDSALQRLSRVLHGVVPPDPAWGPCSGSL